MIESLESRSLMSASFATMTGAAMLSPSVPSVTMSRSDLGAKLAVQLNEANNIVTVLAPATPPPPPPPPPNTIGVVVK
jgi:hypothetical protein